MMIRCDRKGCDREGRRYRIQIANILTLEMRAKSDYTDIDLCSIHSDLLIESIFTIIDSYRESVKPKPMPEVLASAMKKPTPGKRKK